MQLDLLTDLALQKVISVLTATCFVSHMWQQAKPAERPATQIPERHNAFTGAFTQLDLLANKLKGRAQRGKYHCNCKF